jgi:hypothetical protein
MENPSVPRNGLSAETAQAIQIRARIVILTIAVFRAGWHNALGKIFSLQQIPRCSEHNRHSVRQTMLKDTAKGICALPISTLVLAMIVMAVILSAGRIFHPTVVPNQVSKKSCNFQERLTWGTIPYVSPSSVWFSVANRHTSCDKPERIYSSKDRLDRFWCSFPPRESLNLPSIRDLPTRPT